MGIKLGLIAISGVRAYNQELTKLGLTLPGFIERNKVIASLPSLGLLTLGGLTDDNFDIDYIEVPEINDIDYLPKEYDIVAISSFSAKIKDAYTLADRYRKEGTTVILGGLHVTAMPEEALLHADSIIIGEGEVFWEKLLYDYRYKKLKRVYDARGNEFDFNDAPMPKFDLLNIEDYNRLTVQTQRGCVHSCEFCGSSRLLTPKFKIKPIDKIIKEIHEIKKIWKDPFIEFADDNSFVNKKHSKELLKKLSKENLKWFTETDISVAQDDELLALMRDSGCKQILIGLETTSLSQLNGLETRTNWKAKQLDNYYKSIEKIQSYGITVNGTFIFGLDGQTKETFDDVFNFVDNSGLYEVQVTLQTPFPGTKLYERLKQENRLITDDAWELSTLFDINFKPDLMTVKELNEHFTQLVKKIYGDDFTKKRKSGFYERLKQKAI
jgi:radical SAM superfamily enzyme YgiQ (UPF0313 family)